MEQVTVLEIIDNDYSEPYYYYYSDWHVAQRDALTAEWEGKETRIFSDSFPADWIEDTGDGTLFIY